MTAKQNKGIYAPDGSLYITLTDGGGNLVTTGGGDMLSTNNLSDLANKSTARTNLGVAIGTNVQAFNASTMLGTNNLSDLSNASTSRTNLGLGTASTQATGTSGATIPLLNGANTWASAQTFTTAPVFTDASGSRTALGLGTAAIVATGSSGHTLPFLDATNTFSGSNTFSSLTNVAVSAAGSHVLALSNTNNTAGDRGIRFQVGPTAASDSTTIYMHFLDGAGGTIYGSISRGNASTVAYNVTSDRNLKQDIEDAPQKAGLALISQIQPREYSMKSDLKKTRTVGLIAQELYEVKPEAVTPGHEETPWAINYINLIPNLILALQQADAKIKDLTDRVAKLENSET